MGSSNSQQLKQRQTQLKRMMQSLPQSYIRSSSSTPQRQIYQHADQPSVRSQSILLNAGQINQYISSLNTRRVNPELFVQLLYGNVEKNQKEYMKIKVFVENVILTLQNFVNLPFIDCLMIFHKVFRGFKILYENYGSFAPDPRMIGFNQNGQVKVWANEKFSKSRPRQAYQMYNQQRMVQGLIQIFSSKVDLTTVPLDSHRRKFNLQAKTFDQAIQLIQTQIDPASIPNYIQSITGVIHSKKYFQDNEVISMNPSVQEGQTQQYQTPNKPSSVTSGKIASQNSYFNTQNPQQHNLHGSRIFKYQAQQRNNRMFMNNALEMGARDIINSQPMNPMQVAAQHYKNTQYPLLSAVEHAVSSQSKTQNTIDSTAQNIASFSKIQNTIDSAAQNTLSQARVNNQIQTAIFNDVTKSQNSRNAIQTAAKDIVQNSSSKPAKVAPLRGILKKPNIKFTYWDPRTKFPQLRFKYFAPRVVMFNYIPPRSRVITYRPITHLPFNSRISYLSPSSSRLSLMTPVCSRITYLSPGSSRISCRSLTPLRPSSMSSIVIGARNPRISISYGKPPVVIQKRNLLPAPVVKAPLIIKPATIVPTPVIKQVVTGPISTKPLLTTRMMPPQTLVPTASVPTLTPKKPQSSTPTFNGDDRRIMTAMSTAQTPKKLIKSSASTTNPEKRSLRKKKVTFEEGEISSGV